MRLRLTHILIIALSVFVLACDESDIGIQSSVGHININAVIDRVDDNADSTIALTLSTEDGAYSRTWTDIKDFPSYDSFQVGRYIAKTYVGSEGDEGYDCPYYAGDAIFDVVAGETTDVTIHCTLQQAIVYIDTDTQDNAPFSISGYTLHTPGNGYIEYPVSEVRPVYINTGSLSVFFNIEDKQGRVVSIAPDYKLTVSAAQSYRLSVSVTADDDIVMVSADSRYAMHIPTEVFDSSSPSIICNGFNSNSVVNLTEGFPSDCQLSMSVFSDLPLHALKLTVQSTGLIDPLPSESNLLDAQSEIYRYGLDVTSSDDTKYEVSFNRLLESLLINSNSDLKLTLQAEDCLGRVSAPIPLCVNIGMVDVTIDHVTKAEIGYDTSDIFLNVSAPQVEIDDFSFYISDPNDGKEIKAEIISVTNDETNQWSFRIRVPKGITSLPFKVFYMDQYKTSGIIDRDVPEYRLAVDAFATSVRLQYIAESPELVTVLTEYAEIEFDDDVLTITERDTDAGILVVSGLKPSTHYKVTSKIIEGSYAPTAEFDTESAAQLPEPDFEDVTEIIGYKDLLSGGIYSATSFPIYNRQNTVDISVSWPKKYWSSINAKTFCTNAESHNTWYLQPSAYVDFNDKASGSKSICVTSVGWSLHGEDIPPYVQDGSTYLHYNANVPKIDHVSAGYLFLGSYMFNPSNQTESYTEGVSFSSRPSSLNGYYKYIPDRQVINDHGWAEVQLIHQNADGNEQVIASGRMEYINAPYFRSFNLPLQYFVYNLKATKVKVIFCSSVMSEGLSLDDPLVPVSADVPAARFVGSSLWIDNLSFSY